MEKIVYLTFPEAGFDPEAYRDHVLGDVVAALTSAGVRGLNVSLNDLQKEIPKPMLLIGEGATLGAAVSVWLDSLCLLYTSPSPRDKRQSRMPSSA